MFSFPHSCVMQHVYVYFPTSFWCPLLFYCYHITTITNNCCYLYKSFLSLSIFAFLFLCNLQRILGLSEIILLFVLKILNIIRIFYYKLHTFVISNLPHEGYSFFTKYRIIYIFQFLSSSLLEMQKVIWKILITEIYFYLFLKL
jgi:hypothetical protein